jgi:hypothetical protein
MPHLKRRFLRWQSVVVFCAGLIPVTVMAERQYWVSVASFERAEQADVAIREADRSVPEGFSVVGIPTDAGYVYRVASGPFSTRELAEAGLSSVRAAGYDDAWLWSADTSQIEQGVTLASGYERDSSLGAYEPLPDYEPASYEIDDVRLEPRTQMKEVPKLVIDAPENYQLNRLHRDD